jgi:hypothetical protein
VTVAELVAMYAARGVDLVRDPDGYLGIEGANLVSATEMDELRRRKPEILAYLVRRPAPRQCPLCGAAMRHSVVSGTDLFVCASGCPGARIARHMGYPVPGCGPLYRALIKRAEQRARKGETVGLAS